MKIYNLLYATKTLRKIGYDERTREKTLPREVMIVRTGHAVYEGWRTKFGDPLCIELYERLCEIGDCIQDWKDENIVLVEILEPQCCKGKRFLAFREELYVKGSKRKKDGVSKDDGDPGQGNLFETS